MSRVLLQAHGLVKGYRTEGGSYLPVLRGIDLEVVEGEMMAIVGASGVGKSTLLHVLGSLDEPESGEVLFESSNLFAMADPERTRFRNRTMGFIFQFHHLLPEFTALENVMMPLLIGRTSAGDAARAARGLLEAMGLSERLDHRPAQLSGGEQQRVAVARALVSAPRLILADEPTGNLDTHTSDDLTRQLRSIQRDRGLTSIVVTHSEKIASICDRVIRMEDGKLVS